MTESRQKTKPSTRVDEQSHVAESKSSEPFAAAAAFNIPNGGTAVTAASPGEIVQTETSVTTLPDGSVATTVVTTTTVTTTTTTTTTTRTFLTGEIPPVTVQERKPKIELPIIEAKPEAQKSETQEPAPQVKVQPKPQVQPEVQSQQRTFTKPLPYRIAKRAFDIVFSALVIVVLFIPGLFLSIAVAASTKGTPFYTQERVGQHGKRFRMYKFRTMVADSDDLEKHFTPKQLREWRAEHKVKNDPRITPLGQFLRRTSIDEFPNFLNVFAGQMSVVGPRAITKSELHWFGDDVDEMLSVPAGITGWWQVESRNNATFKSGERQQLELHYVRHANASFDLHIMLRTLGAMVKGTGN